MIDEVRTLTRAVFVPIGSGGPQDLEHDHGAGDATYCERLDDLVETIREGERLQCLQRESQDSFGVSCTQKASVHSCVRLS